MALVLIQTKKLAFSTWQCIVLSKMNCWAEVLPKLPKPIGPGCPSFVVGLVGSSTIGPMGWPPLPFRVPRGEVDPKQIT